MSFVCLMISSSCTHPPILFPWTWFAYLGMLSHRCRIPPLEIAITSCRAPFLGETRSTVHSLPTVLMADQTINATQIEIGGALS